MNLKKIIMPFLICIAVFYNCKDEAEKNKNLTKSEMNTDNILLKEWTGEYQGVPAFDKMNVENIKEAVEVGMDENLEEILVIANNTETPNFENTIEAMERSGKTLNRVFSYYGILSSNKSSPEFRKIQSELAPKLSEFNSKITQNEKLFIRIKAVYDASKKTALRTAATASS